MSKSRQPRNAYDQEKYNHLLYSRRVLIVILFAFLGILGLIARAFYLQIYRFSYFSTQSDSNRVSLEVLPPVRGNIYDRNGIALSENILTYDLVVIPKKVNKLEEQLNQLKQYIRFNDEDYEQFKRNRRKSSDYKQIVVRSDLTEKEKNFFLVDLFLFPGFDVVPSFKRYYPYGELTAHVVGYINNINAEDLKEIDRNQYEGTSKIGRTGIEKVYEKRLHGQAGYHQVERTSTGRVIRTLEKVEPMHGEDLHLSLDLKLQRIITEELEKNHFNGSGVAIDPRNGEVLALVSNPGFDANLFVNGISHQDYALLRDSDRKRLYNRALFGNYAPASTIKPLMALASMHYNVASDTDKINCLGSYQIPDFETDKRFFCWNRSGHGPLNVSEAIEQSCDTYFYTTGYELGINRINEYFKQFGFGEKTGIDLPNESSGLLPSRAWKEERHDISWFIGDTINVSIGQGYMLCTPLQLASSVATIANGGYYYKPHLLKAVTNITEGKKEVLQPPPKKIKQNNKNAWKVVHDAMIDVFHSRKGTGYNYKPKLDFTVAAKTGTAQVFSFRNNERLRQDELDSHLRDNSLFIAYAPSDEPIIAFSLVNENSSGGETGTTPLASRILERYFGEESDSA